MKHLTDVWLSRYLEQPERFNADFAETKKKVADSGAVYKGEPVPFLYIPKLFTPADIERFETCLAHMFKIVNRMIELYLEKPEIRAFYDFSPELDELIRLEHGYKVKVPMGRFDIFYRNDGSFQFCELNADGASAMNEETELTDILLHTALMEEMAASYAWKRFELFHSWVETVQEIYREFTHSEKLPHVAIVDFIDKGSSLEFQVFQRAFKDAGMPCSIVDPRDIIVGDGYMHVGGERIDLVYRRLVTRDMMDRYDDIPGFVEGLKAGKTCVVGPVKSQIIHTKKFFEALHDPDIRAYFTNDQLGFIDAHVPFTGKLQTVEKRFTDDKDRWIIKPIDYYASKGVYAGEDFTDQEWAKILRDNTGDAYLIQEYCRPALSDNVMLSDDGAVRKERFRNITGLFVYGERLAGIYSRAGRNPIISGIHQGFTLSSLIVEEK